MMVVETKPMRYSLAFFLALLTGCSPALLTEWRNIAPVAPGDVTQMDLYEKGRAELKLFGEKPQRYRYQRDSSSLTFTRRGETRQFGLTYQSPDSLVMIRQQLPSEKIMVLLPKERYLAHLKSGLGHQKHIRALLGALQASTVQSRATNVVALFGEGDFADTRTILMLLGLPYEPTPNERDDYRQQRILAKKIKRIYRRGDRFIFELYNPEPFDTTIPIYGKDQTGEGKFEIDLAVSQEVYLQVKVVDDALKIDVSGVKVGKGWFKIGVPTLKVKDDYGYLLGIKFYLGR